MVCPYGRGGSSQCGHFADKRRGQFSRFFADVLYGRPLTVNTIRIHNKVCRPVYTWSTFTSLKLNIKRTHYSMPAIFSSVTIFLSLNYNLSVKFSDYVYFLRFYDLFSFTLVR